MISGTERLSRLFSIFHDGGLALRTSSGDDLDLDVEIKYLAERVNPNFCMFHIRLCQVSNLVFKTWPNEPQAEPEQISDEVLIFLPKLEILSSEVDGDTVKVLCSQISSNFHYIGGDLFFKAMSAVVTDEAGKEYCIKELQQLCEGYWSDWKNRWQQND